MPHTPTTPLILFLYAAYHVFWALYWARIPLVTPGFGAWTEVDDEDAYWAWVTRYDVVDFTPGMERA